MTRRQLQAIWEFSGRYVLFFLVLTGVLTLCVAEYRHKKNSYLRSQIFTLNRTLSAGTRSRELQLRLLYNQYINTRFVRNLLQIAVHGTVEEQILARKELYRDLLPFFALRKTFGISQIHIYFPDGTCFLRMSQPMLYGDKIFGERPLIREAAFIHHETQGFEVGKIDIGYRYVFDINDRENNFGTVEFVISANAFYDALYDFDPTPKFLVMINKSIVERILLPEYKKKYSISRINSSFIVEDSYQKDNFSNNYLFDINKDLRRKIALRESIYSGNPYVEFLYKNSTAYVVTFLPLLDGFYRPSGYLISYKEDTTLQRLKNVFILQIFCICFIFLCILILIVNIQKKSNYLIQSRRDLKAINNTLAEGVYVLDIKGNISYINPSACFILGYKEEDLVGKSAHNAFHVHEDEYAKELQTDCVYFHKALRGEDFDGEEFFWHKDGHKIPVEMASRPLVKNGKTLGTVTAFHDISERLRIAKALSERETMLRTITENMPVGFMIVDAETRSIERVNPMAARMFGAPAEQIRGRICHSFLCPAEEYSCPIMDKGQEVDNSDRIMIRADGSHLSVLKTVTTMLIGGRLKLMECMVDIQDRKNAEKYLRDANSKLEDAISQTQELVLAAESATRLKGDFLASMSHELRTPMNAILGMTHLVLRSELTAVQREYLENVQRSGKSLLRLINDILDLSKIEAGRIEFESAPFDLAEVLDSVAAVTAVRLREGVELVIDVSPATPWRLVGDSLRLGQVLINLAGNAAKFTATGEVRLNVAFDQYLSDGRVQLRFMVMDTGVGMENKDLEHLFEPFVQGDASTARRYGGSGLGLSIARSLVQLSGGELSAYSTPGQGSVFSFYAAFERIQDDWKVLIPEYKRAPVLVADDRESSRQALVTALHRLGLEVDTVSTQDALANTLAEGKHAVLFLNWELEGECGITVWDGLSADAREGVHSILLVPLGRGEVLEEASRFGFAAVLSKPVGRDVLTRAVFQALAVDPVFPEPAQDLEENFALHFLGGRILLAEDNSINQRVAQNILQNAGLVVDVVNNGAEALEFLKNHAVDVVCMDLHMPVMDGFAAVRKIREHPRLKNLPVVAMTAHVSEDIRREARLAGMDDEIEKPLNVTELFQVLGRWLTPRKIEKNSEEQADILPVLPEVSEIDLSEGLRRFSGNLTHYQKSLVQACALYAAAPEKIALFLEEGELQEAALLLHTLRGVAANLSAKELYRTVVRAEEHLANGQDMQPLLVELQESIQNFSAIVGSLPVAAKEQLQGKKSRTASLVELLNDLYQEFEQQKPVRCRELLAVLRSEFLLPEKSLSQLEECLSRYAFHEAALFTKTILETMDTE